MTNEAINKLNIYSNAFNQIRDVLNERNRRLFLAESAVQAGFGAITILSKRTGVAISTIRRGIAELSSQESPSDGHIRCSGAGRKPVEETYPDITKSVQADKGIAAEKQRSASWMAIHHKRLQTLSIIFLQFLTSD